MRENKTSRILCDTYTVLKLLFVARKYTKRVFSSHLLTEPNQHILQHI